MRLASFAIRKFKAIDEITIVMPHTAAERPGSANFLSLVGRNNCAKSSVLEALRLMMPGTELTRATGDHFHHKDPNNGAIEIECEFDELTAADQDEQGIRTHVHNGKYRIKKQWDAPGAAPKLFAYEPTHVFEGWPAAPTKQNLLAAGEAWAAVVTAWEAENNKVLPNRAISGTNVDALKEIAVKTNAPVVQAGPPGWVENPGGFSSHVDSVLPKVIFVAAIKETKDTTDCKKTTSPAYEIISDMFDRQLAGNPAVLAFKNAGEQVQQLFQDGEGSEIVRQMEVRVSAKLKRLIDVAVELDFDPPDFNKNLASSTQLWTKDRNLRLPPEHQGHGTQRALILSLLELRAEMNTPVDENAFQRGVLFLVEEPEIYLHPEMCRKMRDALVKIARSDSGQVLCTTHSPVFLDLADRHDGIVMMSRTAQGAVEHTQRTDDLFGGDGADEQRARLRMLLNFDPTANEVFFTDHVCLVEGDCELASTEAIARKLAAAGTIAIEKYLFARRNVAMINCRGKWTIRAFQRVLNGFEIDYRVVHDRDAEGNGPNTANAAILGLLNGDENRRLVHEPNFEQQRFGENWNDDKPWRATRKVEDADAVSDGLREFFEFVLGKSINDLTVAVGGQGPAPANAAVPIGQAGAQPLPA